MFSIALRAFVLISIALLAAGSAPPRPSATAGVFDEPTVFSLRGSGVDSIEDLATDAEGNLYIVGVTTSPDLPMKNAAQPALNGGASDAFVAKLAPGGAEVLWATYLGGSDADAANFVAVDGAGNVYVAGATKSADFPLTVDRLGTPGVFPVAFVTKFDRDGELVYSTVMDGIQAAEDLRGLAVDRGGNSYVVGKAWPPAENGWPRPNLPTTPGALQAEPGDGFIAKFDRSGAPVHISYLAASANSVAAGQEGEALVGCQGGRLLRIDSSGSRLTGSAYVGGEDKPDFYPDAAMAMNTDEDGNVYVAGTTTQPDFPVRPPARFRRACARAIARPAPALRRVSTRGICS
jgi:hypothetical protein